MLLRSETESFGLPCVEIPPGTAHVSTPPMSSTRVYIWTFSGSLSTESRFSFVAPNADFNITVSIVSNASSGSSAYLLPLGI